MEEIIEDGKRLGDQSALNFLAVATDARTVHLYTFGVFPCLEHRFDLEEVSRFRSVALSDDLSLLTITAEAKGGTELHMAIYKVPLLASRRCELRTLASKYGRLSSLLSYLAATVKSVAESWEDILLEIDSKLAAFAAEKRRLGVGAVGDDFLDLLMFGTMTDELHKFLLHDLTEKGLKRLGHSIELSYMNIQKLVLKHLQSVGHALVYHLADIRGMALWTERFGPLGLDAGAVDRCVAVAGSFVLKATELQQVIDRCMKNFKAFFQWLYVVILRMTDEPIPGEINKVTQQDLRFVAEFLNENFADETEEIPEGTEPVLRRNHKLERVGQYLKNEDLQLPPDMSNNPWVAFLERHPVLKDDPLLYPYPANKSLIQVHTRLQEEFSGALEQVGKHIGKTVIACSDPLRLACIQSSSSQTLTQRNATSTPPKTKVKQMFTEWAGLLTVYSVSEVPCTHLVVVKHPVVNCNWNEIQAAIVKFDELGSVEDAGSAGTTKCVDHVILDFQFYNEEVLSVLLAEDRGDGTPVLVQVSLKTVLATLGSVLVQDDKNWALADASGVPVLNGGRGLAHHSYHRLEGMRASGIAMSGARRVACVTFASRRRVRLFEMDGEDEEEESSSLQPEDLDATTGSSSRGNESSATVLTMDSMDDEGENDEDKENYREMPVVEDLPHG